MSIFYLVVLILFTPNLEEMWHMLCLGKCKIGTRLCNLFYLIIIWLLCRSSFSILKHLNVSKDVSTHRVRILLALVRGGDDSQILNHLLGVFCLPRSRLTSGWRRRGDGERDETWEEEKRKIRQSHNSLVY